MTVALAGSGAKARKISQVSPSQQFVTPSRLVADTCVLLTRPAERHRMVRTGEIPRPAEVHAFLSRSITSPGARLVVRSTDDARDESERPIQSVRSPAMSRGFSLFLKKSTGRPTEHSLYRIVGTVGMSPTRGDSWRGSPGGCNNHRGPLPQRPVHRSRVHPIPESRGAVKPGSSLNATQDLRSGRKGELMPLTRRDLEQGFKTYFEEMEKCKLRPAIGHCCTSWW